MSTSGSEVLPANEPISPRKSSLIQGQMECGVSYPKAKFLRGLCPEYKGLAT